MIMKHSEKIRLYTSYFDYCDRIRPQSVLAIFQDMACIHGEELGVGFKTMLDKNLYWVLSRVKYDIIKMPHIDQEVIVETWPHKKGLIDFDRDYLILDEKGNVLIKGTSKWCVIDTIKRSLARTDDVNYIGDPYDKVLYNEKFLKTSVVEKASNNLKSTYTISYADLDHNNHTNNTYYANMIYSVIDNKDIKHLQINYINESLLNDQLQIVSKIDDGEYITGYCNDKIIFTAYVK